MRMELKELRKLPMPKLRDLAKQETDLTGVVGMEKERDLDMLSKPADYLFFIFFPIS